MLVVPGELRPVQKLKAHLPAAGMSGRKQQNVRNKDFTFVLQNSSESFTEIRTCAHVVVNLFMLTVFVSPQPDVCEHRSRD